MSQADQREQNRNVSDYTQRRTQTLPNQLGKVSIETDDYNPQKQSPGCGRENLISRVPHRNTQMAHFSTKNYKNYEGTGKYNTFGGKEEFDNRTIPEEFQTLKLPAKGIKTGISYILKELKEIKRILYE